MPRFFLSALRVPRLRSGAMTRRMRHGFAAGVLAAVVLGLGACSGTQSLRQLDAADVAQIKIGDTAADVLARLGPAANVERRDRFGREVWTYDYTDRSLTRAYRVLYLYFDPGTGRLQKTESGVDWDLYPDAQGR